MKTAATAGGNRKKPHKNLSHPQHFLLACILEYQEKYTSAQVHRRVLDMLSE